MVAQINTEVFDPRLSTPERDPFDSEGVLLALETARGLESEGDFGGAVQWLRRAVREAEKQGNVVRAEDLALAAEELAAKADPEGERMLPLSSDVSSATRDHSMQVVRSNAATAPFAESRAHRSDRSGAPPAASPTGSIPPLLAALISSMPPFSSRASAEIPPPPTTPAESPLPTSAADASPSEACTKTPKAESGPHAVAASAANDNIFTATPQQAERSIVGAAVHVVEGAVAVDVPANRAATPVSDSAVESRSRVCAFRAAIPVSGHRMSSFFIQQLGSGQSAPPGMVEAMIVVTGESDGTISFEASLCEGTGAAKSA